MGYWIGSLLFILNLFDALATHYSIYVWGIANELNPLVAWAVPHLGAWWLIPKILIGVWAMLVVWNTWNKSRRTRWTFGFCVGVYALINLSHTLNIFLFS